MLQGNTLHQDRIHSKGCEDNRQEGDCTMKLHKIIYEPVEPGTYDAILSKTEDSTGQFGPQVMFSFDLGENRILRAWASGKLSPKSKMGGWVKALLGELPDELDTAALVGTKCRVKVDIDIKDDGKEFSRIVDVLAPRKGTPVPEDDADPVCVVCGKVAELYNMKGPARCHEHATPENQRGAGQ